MWSIINWPYRFKFASYGPVVINKRNKYSEIRRELLVQKLCSAHQRIRKSLCMLGYSKIVKIVIILSVLAVRTEKSSVAAELADDRQVQKLEYL